MKDHARDVKRPVTFRATVEAMEPMGNETYIYFTTSHDGLCMLRVSDPRTHCA